MNILAVAADQAAKTSDRERRYFSSAVGRCQKNSLRLRKNPCKL